MKSYVNMKSHQMKVYKNGKLLRTLPVSTGRPGPKTETRYGIKVIVSKEPTHIMDSTSIGISKGSPGYYRITTHWDMRLTWSGEFLHSAPWSVGAQGNTNVSHGCTNLSPSNAIWLYDISKVGDVVKYTGSSRAIEPGNGYTDPLNRQLDYGLSLSSLGQDFWRSQPSLTSARATRSWSTVIWPRAACRTTARRASRRCSPVRSLLV